MRIYTRTGDRGETGLLGGIRVPKDHVRVAAYGEVDELNAHIGSLRRLAGGAAIGPVLESVQELLLEAGAELARAPGGHANGGTLREEDVTALEAEIDKLETDLPTLRQFILPGGSEAACAAHVARCVCRRAERAVVRLLRAEPGETLILRYLNRLSDFLFVLARWADREAGVPDRPWRPRASPSNPAE
jgi:cob(I)alamin adenosyltransferase